MASYSWKSIPQSVLLFRAPVESCINMCKDSRYTCTYDLEFDHFSFDLILI